MVMLGRCPQGAPWALRLAVGGEAGFAGSAARHLVGGIDARRAVGLVCARGRQRIAHALADGLQSVQGAAGESSGAASRVARVTGAHGRIQT